MQGNALEQETFASRVHPADTFIQLVGVPHPSPSKGEQFRAVDLVSVQASVAAAIRAKVQHFIYLSVAQPAPMMEDYIAVRAAGEALLRESRLNVTVLRPWYVWGRAIGGRLFSSRFTGSQGVSQLRETRRTGLAWLRSIKC